MEAVDTRVSHIHFCPMSGKLLPETQTSTSHAEMIVPTLPRSRSGTSSLAGVTYTRQLFCFQYANLSARDRCSNAISPLSHGRVHSWVQHKTVICRVSSGWSYGVTLLPPSSFVAF